LILTQQQSQVVGEIRASTISERGARIDDKRSEAAMEKKENNKILLEILKIFFRCVSLSWNTSSNREKR
jgi:hypothetical protein